ncbi:MAG TPA: bifunctional demethylmenaquinone methyltransferase/2-methoxy-6-polyprenyl-1,4-benzoquinol methylase UbiE [Gammaproteobacteria bacterium]|nr:bifunctional demethylmenaquinone methyltransferase/2-methoxy-6-polyprenyl-1,4-benzoquinol methylase UbiE [Gammaproteobacteria bacterium]
MSNDHKQKDSTHFGYQNVPVSEKAGMVADVFHSVASKYDIMNDAMSLGVHRLWKQFAIAQAGVRPGHRVLDLACGTGDLSLKMSPQAGPDGMVIASDINASMLQNGRDRLIDKGIINNVQFVQADAEKLPFADNSVDRITIAFGLRNVTDQKAALAAMYCCLRPGGRLIILEFSKPVLPGLDKIYDLYSFKILPQLGKIIANDEASYRYLAESIRKHPDQETLKAMMVEAGFDRPHYHNLSGGIVAVHKGYKV